MNSRGCPGTRLPDYPTRIGHYPKLPETRFSSFSATRSYPKPEQFFSGTRKQFSVNFNWLIIDNFGEIFRPKYFTKLKTYFKEELLIRFTIWSTKIYFGDFIKNLKNFLDRQIQQCICNNRVPDTRIELPETRRLLPEHYPIVLTTRKSPNPNYPIPENLLPGHPLLPISCQITLKKFAAKQKS